MLNKEIRDNLKRDVPLLKNVYLKMWEKYTGTSHIVKTFRDRDWWIAIKNNVFNRLQNPVLKFPVIPGDESVCHTFTHLLQRLGKYAICVLIIAFFI